MGHKGFPGSYYEMGKKFGSKDQEDADAKASTEVKESRERDCGEKKREKNQERAFCLGNGQMNGKKSGENL